MRYVRMLVTIMSASLQAQMAFRGSFILTCVSTVLEVGLTLVFFNLVFAARPTALGWTYQQVLLLVGTYQLVEGLFRFLLAGGGRLAQLVETGNLDMILVRPCNPQYLISIGRVNWQAVPRALIGLTVVIRGALAGDGLIEAQTVTWLAAAKGAGLYGLLVVAAVLMRYAVSYMVNTAAIWLVRVDALQSLAAETFSLAQYPAVIFKRGARLFFSFVIPVLFVANVPANALQSSIGAGMVVQAILTGSALLMLSHWFWRYALRKYSSAGG